VVGDVAEAPIRIKRQRSVTPHSGLAHIARQAIDRTHDQFVIGNGIDVIREYAIRGTHREHLAQLHMCPIRLCDRRQDPDEAATNDLEQ
jgi:hypothetical protein